MEQSEIFSFAGVYDRDGRMICHSAPPPPGWTFPDELRGTLDARTPHLGILEQAEFTGRPVLYAQVPVKDHDGEVVAQAAVSVPHDVADRLDELFANGPDLALITFEADRDGAQPVGRARRLPIPAAG